MGNQHREFNPGERLPNTVFKHLNPGTLKISTLELPGSIKKKIIMFPFQWLLKLYLGIYVLQLKES
jgi:hypothetical protein